MSDSVRMPPRPPGSPSTTGPRAPEKGAPRGAMQKKKMEDPNAATTLASDSFSRAVTGSSNVQGKVLPGPSATILFSTAAEPALVGELRQDGQLVVSYEPARAPLQEKGFGVPTWGVMATAVFLPGGERLDRAVLELLPRPGRPADVRSLPMTLKVPLTATTVRVSFRNWRRNHPDFHDDNKGAGFVFGVQPPQQRPKNE